MEENQNQPQRAAVRHTRRRSTMNLYLTIAAAVLAAIGSLLSVNVFFNLSPTGLTINGATLYEPVQIQMVGGLLPGQNLIRLNTEFVEKRLRENLVYVDEVEVIKDYPDGLVINIKEARAKAQIEYGGGYCTVSSAGRVLEVGQSERNKKLPLISGFDLVGPEDEHAYDNADDSLSDEERPKVYLPVLAGMQAESSDPQKGVIITQIFSEIDRLSFKKIAKIDIADRTDIKLIYDGRIIIELGSSVDLDIKLAYMQAVIEKLPEGYEGTLRYNGIDRGISAIPKKAEVPKSASTSRPDDSSSSADSMNSQDGTQWTDPNAGNQDGTNTWDNGYWDGGNNWDNGGWDNGGGWDGGNAWDNGGWDNGGGWDDGNYQEQTWW